MEKIRNKYLIYLTFILLLTFSLTIYNFFLSFGHIFFKYLGFTASVPYMDVLINFNYLLLLSLLLILYRRWKEEMKKRKKNEATLLSLQKAVETMQLGVTISDRTGKILYTNPAEAEMHGYRVDELLGKDSRIFGPPETWKPLFKPVLKSFRRETTNVRKDGTMFPVQLMSDVVTSPEGDVFAFVTTCEDIADRKRNEEQIRKLAFYDGLTGLPNRALFNDRLGQELAKARRHKELLAVMFIDLDRFKVVNDTMGHDTGDLLIRAVSKRLKKIIREVDTACRLGGDEFVILFTDIKFADDISVIARKILLQLSEAFVLAGTEVFITASLGVSIFPDHGDGVEALLKNADAAMYYAKEQGRNNYQFYTSTIDTNATERARMQGSLRRAVNQKEFIIYYQPQLDLKTGKIVGAEALARWRHPEYGLVSPAEFIPLAEESGLIDQIGKFLIFTACAQNRAWQEAGIPPIHIAINISTYQFVREDFIDSLKKILDEVGLDPKFLELEFTESIIMKDSELIASTMQQLKALGIQCSIDDFGTGYSSLSYLKYLPIDKIKIDRSFISSLTKNLNDDAISRAVISMAHELNLKVTAEGVENLEQLEFLCSHGCDEAQGFLFSRPLPAEDFVGLITNEVFKLQGTNSLSSTVLSFQDSIMPNRKI